MQMEERKKERRGVMLRLVVWFCTAKTPSSSYIRQLTIVTP